MFFDIEVDFDPERGYSTTDDPVLLTAPSCYMSWTDLTGPLAVPSKQFQYARCKNFDRTFSKHDAF